MRHILILLFLSFPLILQAKKRNPVGEFNSEAFWKKVRLEKHLPAWAITPDDTTLVVVSNRKASGDSLRYMSEERDANKLHYFFVYTGGGIWHVLEVASLEQAIQYMPDKNNNWIVYTEGMGKLFTTDIARGIVVAGQYKVNVILLDYPSISSTKRSIGNYFFAMKNAKTNYKDFTPVLQQIKDLRKANKMGNGKLSLFYHSMGNNLQREMVRHNRHTKLNDEVWVDNLILNAPCVPRRGCKKWLPEIKYAKNTYVHYNIQDFTLGGAYLLSKKIQFGQKPVRRTCDGVNYINFNTLCGKDHSNFLSIPGRAPARHAAIRHYSAVLHGEKVNLNDTKLYQPTEYKKVGYDLLP